MSQPMYANMEGTVRLLAHPGCDQPNGHPGRCSMMVLRTSDQNLTRVSWSKPS